MVKSRTLWKTVRSALAPAAGLLVMVFFGGYALFGANGALAWGDYSKKLAERRVLLGEVRKDRDRLAHRVALLDPRHADPDLADELVRRDLGVAAPNEIIVPLK